MSIEVILLVILLLIELVKIGSGVRREVKSCGCHLPPGIQCQHGKVGQ